jgi:hypothetical protein
MKVPVVLLDLISSYYDDEPLVLLQQLAVLMYPIIKQIKTIKIFQKF